MVYLSCFHTLSPQCPASSFLGTTGLAISRHSSSLRHIVNSSYPCLPRSTGTARHLTIQSSRRGFATRLISGVRCYAMSLCGSCARSRLLAPRTWRRVGSERKERSRCWRSPSVLRDAAGFASTSTALKLVDLFVSISRHRSEWASPCVHQCVLLTTSSRCEEPYGCSV